MNIWSLTRWFIVERLSSDSVLVVEEGWGLHDTTNDIIVGWSLEQVKECIMHFLGYSLVIIVHFVWSCEVWSSEHSTTWLDHLIVLLLLSLTMENPTTVDNTNGGKFRVFSNDLLVVIW